MIAIKFLNRYRRVSTALFMNCNVANKKEPGQLCHPGSTSRLLLAVGFSVPRAIPSLPDVALLLLQLFHLVIAFPRR